jgi:hypothetical protein
MLICMVINVFCACFWSGCVKVGSYWTEFWPGITFSFRNISEYKKNIALIHYCLSVFPEVGGTLRKMLKLLLNKY